ncbi:hypothetical protein CC80DRAFT_34276 [Byssothecium circinans]|uniref:Uncharacterized protein n=1 Tax=Byssothecium circinans TaxID=147558 RepID=A0A6A5TYW4_9PLEO|nr:hypothetical protein CC80DRAFT_34276 [Byssothecium circinans]
MADALPFGYTHRNKRSHAQMDLEDSASPHWSPFGHHLSASPSPSAEASHAPHPNVHHLPHVHHRMPPQRYHGDGLDYRRPVSSSNVIDLTDEDAVPTQAQPRDQHRPPRPPRFGRDIMQEVIDLDAEEPQRLAPRSPEIQFVSSRSIDRPNLDRVEDQGQDEVEFVRENPLPWAQRRLDGPNQLADFMQALQGLPRLRAEWERGQERERHGRRAERQRQATIDRFLQVAGNARNRGAAPRVPPRARGHIHVGFMAPQMNYGEVAFNLGYTHDDGDEAPAPPAPTYEAPVQAPQGFTRSPQEEDALVCPNCEEELCVGDTEEKRQVWIVKACGHVCHPLMSTLASKMANTKQVYCGECTANRFKTKSSAKGKEKQPICKKFKECVVEECGKKVSNSKTMVQIFL